MNILISGGSGLIGRALTKDLVDHGHNVFILSRSPEKIDNLSEDVVIMNWDSETTKGWGDTMENIDAVVNLAGSSLNGNGPLDIWLTQKRKKLLLNSRLNASGALVEAIRQSKNKPKVFIQASAVGYYGPQGDEWIEETHPPGDDFLAKVQRQSEKSTEVLETMGIRRVIIRTGLVFANQGSSLEYFLLQFRLFAGGRIGTGKQFYSWIHIQDEVAAIRFLIEHKDASGAFNLVSPNPARNQDFATILGKVMKRPSFFVIPGFLMKLVLGEVSTVILDGQRVSSKKLERHGFSFKFPGLREALEDVI